MLSTESLAKNLFKHSKSIVLSTVLPKILSTKSLPKNLSAKLLYIQDKPKGVFATDSQSIDAMFPKRNLIKYVGNISIKLSFSKFVSE